MDYLLVGTWLRNGKLVSLLEMLHKNYASPMTIHCPLEMNGCTINCPFTTQLLFKQVS